MTPIFRPFASADVEELVTMMRELFEGDSTTFNERNARAGLASIAAADPCGFTAGRVWLIEEEGRAAGYLVLTFAFSLEFGGWHGFIDELFLRDGHRGHGWGTRAIELAASTCRDLGMQVLLLEADLQNARATSLYQRRGFREHRRRLMRLELS